MSVFLNSEAGQWHINNKAWYAVLELALDNNWEPERDCDHYTGEFRVVSAKDGLCMATAVEEAMAKIPDSDAMPKDSVRTFVSPSGMEIVCHEFTTPVTPYQLWSGDGKPKLKEFVRIARAGSFTIS
jgi:hypothetical protein